MQFTSRFTAAIHALLHIAYYSSSRKVTSTFLSQSTGADPTIIRRLLCQLQNSGYVTVKSGVGGASLTVPLEDITLLDIFKSIEANEGSLFKFYENPKVQCPITQNIHEVLDNELAEIQQVMYQKMSQTNLQMLFNRLIPLLSKEDSSDSAQGLFYNINNNSEG